MLVLAEAKDCEASSSRGSWEEGDGGSVAGATVRLAMQSWQARPTEDEDSHCRRRDSSSQSVLGEMKRESCVVREAAGRRRCAARRCSQTR